MDVFFALNDIQLAGLPAFPVFANIMPYDVWSIVTIHMIGGRATPNIFILGQFRELMSQISLFETSTPGIGPR